METEALCQSFEQPQTNTLLTLPTELLVYIMSFLLIHDRIKLRYVSQRLRDICEASVLWNEVVWPYYETGSKICVSSVLISCGEHVRRLRFPKFASAAKLLTMSRGCVNVTELSLPPLVYFSSTQLERIFSTMASLNRLDIYWTENIRPLLEVVGNLRELTIRVKNISDSPSWEFNMWATEGVYLPPVLNIYTTSYYWMAETLAVEWTKWYRDLPKSIVYMYSSAKVPLNLGPSLPLLRFEFGPSASSPHVKVGNYGILGIRFDFETFNMTDFYYKGQKMYCINGRCLFGPWDRKFDVNPADLKLITHYDFGCVEDLYSGHLEQVANACPNLRWLNIKCNIHCLKSLEGLKCIVENCPHLQGLNLLDISIDDVESYVLLWEILSDAKKLSHLSVPSCYLVGRNVSYHQKRELFGSYRNLQGLEYEECVGYCRICVDLHDLHEEPVLSYFPSLTYCRSLYNSYAILQHILTNCQQLKYLSYDDCVGIRSLPSSCCCKLEQLYISGDLMIIGDSFMSALSAHGNLQCLILSVQFVAVKGIHTVIRNSPNLTILCLFLVQPLCSEKGRKISPKDFKAKLKKEFPHHKLFSVGTFRIALDQCCEHLLADLNTELNTLWPSFTY